MKKMLVLIISLICLATLLFIVFIKADDTRLTDKEALEIGEEKYLEFLWMVDGAFNNSKFKEEFIVNGKKLGDDNKKFTCTYKNNNSSCVANNFEEEFERVFSSNLTYNDVYSDGVSYTWFKYEKGKYSFTNLNSCSNYRMNIEQTIKLNSNESDKLTFVVSSKDNTILKQREFILVKENDTWKVDKAYYHDICEIDYYIG